MPAFYYTGCALTFTPTHSGSVILNQANVLKQTFQPNLKMSKKTGHPLARQSNSSLTDSLCQWFNKWPLISANWMCWTHRPPPQPNAQLWPNDILVCQVPSRLPKLRLLCSVLCMLWFMFCALETRLWTSFWNWLNNWLCRVWLDLAKALLHVSVWTCVRVWTHVTRVFMCHGLSCLWMS